MTIICLFAFRYHYLADLIHQAKLIRSFSTFTEYPGLCGLQQTHTRVHWHHQIHTRHNNNISTILVARLFLQFPVLLLFVQILSQFSQTKGMISCRVEYSFFKSISNLAYSTFSREKNILPSLLLLEVKLARAVMPTWIKPTDTYTYKYIQDF